MDERLMEEPAEISEWDSLVAAGAVAAADRGVLAGVEAQVREAAEREKFDAARAQRRRHRVLSAAVLGAAAAIVGVLVLVEGRGPREQPAAAPATSMPAASAASCVESYSLTNLGHRSLAFDGSVERVVAIDKPADAKFGRARVTFVVNRWFRGGTAGRVTVITSHQPPLQMGMRLLVSGETQPSATPIAWTGCGFTRPYNASTAADWETVFKR